MAQDGLGAASGPDMASQDGHRDCPRCQDGPTMVTRWLKMAPGCATPRLAKTKWLQNAPSCLGSKKGLLKASLRFDVTPVVILEFRSRYMAGFADFERQVPI